MDESFTRSLAMHLQAVKQHAQVSHVQSSDQSGTHRKRDINDHCQ